MLDEACWDPWHILMAPGEYIEVALQKADDFTFRLLTHARPYLGRLWRIPFSQIYRFKFLHNLWRLLLNFPLMVFF